MRSQMLNLAPMLVLAFVMGCNTKKVEDQQEGPVESAAPETAVNETEQEPEPEAEEEPDMVVSLEDIEKAAEAYVFLHDEDLTIEEKRARFDEFLKANDWAIEAYADLMYDISQHSSARVAYLEKISP